MKTPEITDYNYFASTVGNAYFSGLDLTDLWNCVTLSENREELDAAVLASIRLKKITKMERNKYVGFSK